MMIKIVKITFSIRVIVIYSLILTLKFLAVSLYSKYYMGGVAKPEITKLIYAIIPIDYGGVGMLFR